MEVEDGQILIAIVAKPGRHVEVVGALSDPAQTMEILAKALAQIAAFWAAKQARAVEPPPAAAPQPAPEGGA